MQDFTLLIGRRGEPTHNLFGFLEFFWTHKNELERNGRRVGEFRCDLPGFLPRRRIGYHK